MARPARPVGEREAVRAAARELGRCRSLSAVAQDIARRVVAEVLAYLDLDLCDPMIAGLVELQNRTAQSPIQMLARCPNIDTAELIMNRRSALFRARGCRQLSAPEWQAETRMVAAQVEQSLTARYARHLRKNIS